ncbi:MAG: hypothetical protein OFPI_32990 [Osedax symbiont Rs2]|nr:MAG: hypothetical protein OFPI_32990 [Osedax symbiont Rs2]
MSLTVIYLHGFNSSPKSIKAQQLQEYFVTQALAKTKNYVLHIPQLDYQPDVAIEQLTELIEACAGTRILLVGSSLGGYYSIWLAQRYPNCRAVLINPAVYPYTLLLQLLGENTNIYSGQKYQLSEVHIGQLQALEVKTISDPDRLLLLCQKGDETLDYKEAVDKLFAVEQRVTAGGSHSFENFTSIIPAVLAFAGDE